MECPECGITLKIADRQGVEIDYCPSCRGVWLERGELDKIIERSMGRTHHHDMPDSHPQKRKRGKGDIAQYADTVYEDIYDDDSDYYTPQHHQYYQSRHPHKYSQKREKYHDDKHRGKTGKRRKSVAQNIIEEIFDIFD